MKLILATVTAPIFFATAVHAETLKFAKATPYPIVRQSLLKHGWKPLIMRGQGECGWDADQCPKVPEVYQCYEGAESGCSFSWRKGSAFILVFARGEGDPQVYSTTKVCKNPVNPTLKTKLECMK